MTLDEIVRMLQASAEQHRYTNEKELQDSIGKQLTESGVPYEREAWLGEQDRIDFLLEGTCGIEVKTKGSLTEVMRQLHRYSCSPRLKSLVLLTDKRKLLILPPNMSGKPLRAVWIQTL